MRSKEEAHDYRYFPDPDLLPLEISEAWLEEVRRSLPELPEAKRARFVSAYGISPYDAAVLTSTRELAAYFEETVAVLPAEPKLCANWVMGEVSGHLNRDGLEIDQSPVSSVALAGLLRRIGDGTISGKIAKDVFEAMWTGAGDADAIIDAQGLRQISDSGELERIVDGIIAANPGQLADYRAGRDKLFAFFVGQVMKQTQGKANPAQVNDILRRKLAR
jgi:aspartyl-tRNA(Asn)/glutamyl-tRNA(Gln) amidotransferase subunit B